MIAFIDCNNLAHRAYHTTGDLSHGGNPTGVIFGFFNQVFNFVRKHPGCELVFCWDSQKSLRKEFYPDYKKRRVPITPQEIETRAELYAQLDTLRAEVLPALGWGSCVWHREGYEADDLIAWGVYAAWDRHVYMVTGDQDLYQALEDGGTTAAVIYSPSSHDIYSERDFRAEYKVTPEQWPMVKAIAGCSSDNVEGVKGVGESTAIKYINGTLKPSTQAYKAIVQAKSAGLTERNLRLVKLPYGEDWDNEAPLELPTVQLKKAAFAEVFEKYEMKSLTKRMGELSINLSLA